jgi:hypothetical protein
MVEIIENRPFGRYRAMAVDVVLGGVLPAGTNSSTVVSRSAAGPPRVCLVRVESEISTLSPVSVAVFLMTISFGLALSILQPSSSM